jgi:hypothetical protein
MDSGMIGYGNWWESTGLAGEVGVVVSMAEPWLGLGRVKSMDFVLVGELVTQLPKEAMR